jgi:hypothetical protein
LRHALPLASLIEEADADPSVRATSTPSFLGDDTRPGGDSATDSLS